MTKKCGKKKKPKSKKKQICSEISVNSPDSQSWRKNKATVGRFEENGGFN